MLFDSSKPMVKGSFATRGELQVISNENLQALIELCKAQASQGNRDIITGRFDSHIGPNSTFSQKTQIKEFLNSIYFYIQGLRPEQSDLKNNIIFKITERAIYCTPGFHCGVVELYNDIFNTPQSIHDYLALMRQDLLTSFASQITDEVHQKNWIFQVASNLYVTMPINDQDPYIRPVVHDRQEEFFTNLSAHFTKNYQFFAIIKDIQERFVSQLIALNYTKGQDFSEHLMNLNRYIAKIFSGHPICQEFLGIEKDLLLQATITQEKRDAINAFVEELFSQYPKLSQLENVNITLLKQALAGNSQMQKIVPYPVLLALITEDDKNKLSSLIADWHASGQAECTLKECLTEQYELMNHEFWDCGTWSIQEDKLFEFIIRELKVCHYTQIAEELILNILQLFSKALSIEEKDTIFDAIISQLSENDQIQMLPFLDITLSSKYYKTVLMNEESDEGFAKKLLEIIKKSSQVIRCFQDLDWINRVTALPLVYYETIPLKRLIELSPDEAPFSRCLEIGLMREENDEVFSKKLLAILNQVPLVIKYFQNPNLITRLMALPEEYFRRFHLRDLMAISRNQAIFSGYLETRLMREENDELFSKKLYKIIFFTPEVIKHFQYPDWIFRVMALPEVHFRTIPLDSLINLFPDIALFSRCLESRLMSEENDDDFSKKLFKIINETPQVIGYFQDHHWIFRVMALPEGFYNTSIISGLIKFFHDEATFSRYLESGLMREENDEVFSKRLLATMQKYHESIRYFQDPNLIIRVMALPQEYLRAKSCFLNNLCIYDTSNRATFSRYVEIELMNEESDKGFLSKLSEIHEDFFHVIRYLTDPALSLRVMSLPKEQLETIPFAYLIQFSPLDKLLTHLRDLKKDEKNSFCFDTLAQRLQERINHTFKEQDVNIWIELIRENISLASGRYQLLLTHVIECQADSFTKASIDFICDMIGYGIHFKVEQISDFLKQFKNSEYYDSLFLSLFLKFPERFLKFVPLDCINDDLFKKMCESLSKLEQINADNKIALSKHCNSLSRIMILKDHGMMISRDELLDLYRKNKQNWDINARIKFCHEFPDCKDSHLIQELIGEINNPCIINNLNEESVRIFTNPILRNINSERLIYLFGISKHANCFFAARFHQDELFNRSSIINDVQFASICEQAIQPDFNSPSPNRLFSKCNSLDKLQIILDKGLQLDEETMPLVQEALKNAGVNRAEMMTKIKEHLGRLDVSSKPVFQSFFDQIHQRKCTASVSDNLKVNYLNLYHLSKTLETAESPARDKKLQEVQGLIDNLVSHISQDYVFWGAYILGNFLLAVLSLILYPLHMFFSHGEDYFYSSPNQMTALIQNFHQELKNQDETVVNTVIQPVLR